MTNGLREGGVGGTAEPDHAQLHIGPSSRLGQRIHLRGHHRGRAHGGRQRPLADDYLQLDLVVVDARLAGHAQPDLPVDFFGRDQRLPCPDQRGGVVLRLQQPWHDRGFHQADLHRLGFQAKVHLRTSPG
jgi:hypothetical protein